MFPLISLPLLSLFVYADSSIENIINNKVLVNGVSSEINGVLSSIPYSTKIIPYKEGSIIVGVGFNKVNSLTKDYDSEGFVQVLDKQGKKILNKSKQFFVDFKKAGILGGILDKEQNNLIFYGYSEANGVLNHFDVLPSEFKHNSVFIGKYNIESNTFQDIKLLDDNSVTTPNTLAMDTDGNFYILYSLEASEQEKDYKKLSTNVFKRTNQVKLVKLNSKLEKLDEKILEECDKCNLNAGGLIIDHSDTLYSAILKNSSELILKTDSFANDQEFSRQSIKFMDSEKSNKSSVHTTVEKIILNNKSIHILVNNKLNKNNGNSILFSYKNNKLKNHGLKKMLFFTMSKAIKVVIYILWERVYYQNQQNDFQSVFYLK